MVNCMFLSPIPAAVHIIQNPLFGESRLEFEGVKETPTVQKGIQFHNKFTAILDQIIHILFRIFGHVKKTIEIVDVDSKVYYLNRADLNAWLAANCKSIKDNPTFLNDVNEETLRNLLDQVLKEKSPEIIVQLSDLKRKYKIDLMFSSANQDYRNNGMDSSLTSKITDEFTRNFIDLEMQRCGLKKQVKMKTIQNVELIHNLSKMNLESGLSKILVPKKNQEVDLDLKARKLDNIVYSSSNFALLIEEFEIFKDGENFRIPEENSEKQLLEELDWTKQASVYRK